MKFTKESLANLPDRDFQDLYALLRHEKDRRMEEERQEKLKENERHLGTCYKVPLERGGYKFFIFTRLIPANTFRLEAFTFKYPIKDVRDSMLPEVESMGINCNDIASGLPRIEYLKGFKISKEEFFQAFEDYWTDLKTLLNSHSVV